MTCAPQAEVWLKCRQLNREQNFSIDAHEFIRFQSELSVENDKCVITARDQTDYQIKEIALKFLEVAKTLLLFEQLFFIPGCREICGSSPEVCRRLSRKKDACLYSRKSWRKS